MAVSQPALTQAIHKLEAQLGEALFERSATGVFPTEAGRILVTRIDKALGHLASAERALDIKPRLGRRATTTQMHALIAVVQAVSMSLAARRMGISQPSVHRAVRDLEKLTGCALFLRVPHGVEPTRQARELSRAASLAFSEIRQGLASIREQRGLMDGQVRVGSLPYARSHLLPIAATALLEKFPALKLKIVDGSYAELLGLLRQGDIDMIIGALRLPPPVSDIRQEKLFSDALSIVVRAGHPILQERSPSPTRLAGLAWIVPRESTPARMHFKAFFERERLSEPANTIECSSLVATRGLLLRGNRAALLPAGQVRYEVEKGDLVVLPKPLPGTERPIGLAMRAEFEPTVAQAELIAFLRKAARRG